MTKTRIVTLVLLTALLLTVTLYFYNQRSLEPEVTEPPYVEPPMPDFSQFAVVNDKKKAFFAYLTPAIEAQNKQIMRQRALVESFVTLINEGETLSNSQNEQLLSLTEQYRVDVDQNLTAVLNELLRRVDVIPYELVLVQSANESAWGTSRFARDGFNFFGQWCFKKGCGFVPIRRNEGAFHEVAKFPNLTSAMKSYMTNLNRHPAYQQLRLIREQHRKNNENISAKALIDGLGQYSERGQHYIDELQQMLRVNRKFM